jgi:hypothetical protein
MKTIAIVIVVVIAIYGMTWGAIYTVESSDTLVNYQRISPIPRDWYIGYSWVVIYYIFYPLNKVWYWWNE